MWVTDFVWHSVLYWIVVQIFKMHSMLNKGLLTDPALLLPPITGSVAM